MTASLSDGNPGSPGCHHNPGTAQVIKEEVGVPDKKYGGN